MSILGAEQKKRPLTGRFRSVAGQKSATDWIARKKDLILVLRTKLNLGTRESVHGSYESRASGITCTSKRGTNPRPWRRASAVVTAAASWGCGGGGSSWEERMTKDGGLVLAVGSFAGFFSFFLFNLSRFWTFMSHMCDCALWELRSKKAVLGPFGRVPLVRRLQFQESCGRAMTNRRNRFSLYLYH